MEFGAFAKHERRRTARSFPRAFRDPRANTPRRDRRSGAKVSLLD
jgi:hypothetical protein